MKYIALLATVAISAVAAQAVDESNKGRLAYSEPIGATVWTAGSTHTVSWTNKCEKESAGALEIVLYLGTGGNGGTEQVRVPSIPAIGTLDCSKAQSAEVKIPLNLTTSDKYSILVGTKPLQSYSSPFTIKGKDPVTTAPAATAAPTNATSAAPSASASATSSNAAGATDSTIPSAAGSLKALGSTAAIFAAALNTLMSTKVADLVGHYFVEAYYMEQTSAATFEIIDGLQKALIQT
ncbi:hypothetical protein BGX27_009135 [Mortierella sp. AM989]|nr:hypothetical protein BGX27_009135 [Mortierella sp. AM989]